MEGGVLGASGWGIDVARWIDGGSVEGLCREGRRSVGGTIVDFE